MRHKLVTQMKNNRAAPKIATTSNISLLGAAPSFQKTSKDSSDNFNVNLLTFSTR